MELDPEHAGAISASLPSWEPFPEVPAALAELRQRGCRLAILSNCDRDLIEASIRRLGVPVDEVVVAEDVRSYKPGHAHWLRFRADTGADPGRHVHVAASRFHDVAPARELAIPCIWINRLGEAPDPVPARELPDLTRLGETLDELVPA
jgi:2-haloacid dehalogenase